MRYKIQERWVVNLSTKELSTEQESILRKGLNFSSTPTKLPIEDLIVTSEEACSMVPTPKADDLRNEVVSIISSHGQMVMQVKYMA